MRLNRLLFSRRVSVGWEFAIPGPGGRAPYRDLGLSIVDYGVVKHSV
jgi:hypothetical protein